MGRAPAAAYNSRMRPYGQPADNYRESTPRPQTVGTERRVHQVMDTSTHVIEPQLAAGCAATTVSGQPCKAHPKVGEDFCAFHKE